MTDRAEAEVALGQGEGVRQGHEAAGGGHDEHLIGQSRQSLQVVAAGRAQVRIDHGREGALVLAELR